MPNAIKPQANDQKRNEKLASDAKTSLLEAKQSFSESNFIETADQVLAAWDTFKQSYGGTVSPEKLADFETALQTDVLENSPKGKPILDVFKKEIGRDENKIREANVRLMEGKSSIETDKWQEGGNSLSEAWQSLCGAYSGGIHRYGAKKFFSIIEKLNNKGGTDTTSEKKLNDIVARLSQLFNETDVRQIENGESFRQDMVQAFLRLTYGIRGGRGTEGFSTLKSGMAGGLASGRLIALERDLGKFNSPDWATKFRSLRRDIDQLNT